MEPWFDSGVERKTYNPSRRADDLDQIPVIQLD
ncbi:hypothetical protein NSPZN2_40669 [Nitrospira defluvii]|uniref:Uncharacterized protein n=1 Tax=Nitrospira defluvii TaxID=330214 RepID=A0ABM8RYV7_9BACT|nr:hypothetical protein NSPZN2_40669 [Nitrospira defluvii]